MKSRMSTSGSYGRFEAPGSRLTVATVDPLSENQGASVEQSKDLPEPAVPVKKIDRIHQINLLLYPNSHVYLAIQFSQAVTLHLVIVTRKSESKISPSSYGQGRVVLPKKSRKVGILLGFNSGSLWEESNVIMFVKRRRNG